jgi:lysophospholipase L1-like esterase
MASTSLGGLGTPEGNRVPIDAGTHHLPDGRVIELTKPADQAFDPAGSKAIENESHVLTTENPDRWSGGTHLDAVKAGGTPLPGCLVPGSVVVKLPDGTIAEREKDYIIDEYWSGLARVEGGRIADKMPVKISYRAALMRLDTIEVDRDGKVSVRTGMPAMTTPHPPEVTPGSTAWANVFMPYNQIGVAGWQVYEIGGPFPEPNVAEMTARSKFVAKTLAKLRDGEPVTVVTWGDSVTVGGDASSGDKAFANLFPARLRERFPKAAITHINAGVGGSNAVSRLTGLQKDVIDHKPDLVTIEFVNDMGVPEAQLRETYKSAFEQMRAVGSEIILITPHFTMPQWMKHAHPRGKETRPTVALLREIAREHNVGLADTSRRWEHLELEGLPYTTLLVNGINHPDDRGHEMFVKDLLTFFPDR